LIISVSGAIAVSIATTDLKVPDSMRPMVGLDFTMLVNTLQGSDAFLLVTDLFGTPLIEPFA
jgi:hypothetical protein